MSSPGVRLGDEGQSDQVFLGKPGEAPEAFAQDVVHWLEQSSRA